MYSNRDIEVKINPANFNHYYEINKNIKNKETYIFDITELTKSSSALINVICDDCGFEKELKYKYYTKYGFNDGVYYCRKCNNIRKTQEKYGVDNVFQLEEVKEKIKKTTNDKYGVDNVSQSKEIRKKKEETYNKRTKEETTLINEKRTKTLIEKYNIDNISKLNEITEKKLITWSKKSVEELDLIIKKRNETHIKNHGSYNKNIRKSFIITKDKQYIKHISGSNHLFKCENKNHDFILTTDNYYNRKRSGLDLCITCNPLNSLHTSGKELKLLNFIKDNYDGEIITSDRKILNGKELDIYLPEIKLAFEFNGIYWHNELNKDKNYHSEKTNLTKQQNINLFHIYEDDWDFRQNIIKSMILNKLNLTKLKIGARKTTINEVTDNKLIKLFLNENHLQGYTTSSKKYGLFYDNELISLMIFKQKDNNYELTRFANKLNTNIIGGASKLIKYFIQNNNFDYIITFSNNDYSDGNLYETLKFKKVKKLLPDYSYVHNKKRVHKFNFRKNKLKKMGFDISEKTEHEICLENGFYRIYDSGKIKWKLKKTINF